MKNKQTLIFVTNKDFNVFMTAGLKILAPTHKYLCFHFQFQELQLFLFILV